MSTHELVFHLTAQDLITTNLRLHWREDRKRSRNLRALAGWAARSSRVPAMPRVRIVARITWPDRRRRDAHNLVPTLKHLVDGLVDAGVVEDDDDKHLVGPDCRASDDPLPRAEWVSPVAPTTRIVLEITDLGEEVTPCPTTTTAPSGATPAEE